MLQSLLKSSLKSHEEFLNEIVNEEKYINENIFRDYFRYQNPSSLVKDLFRANKNNNDKTKCLIIIELIKIMEGINIKKITENENLQKVANIVNKSLLLTNI